MRLFPAAATTAWLLVLTAAGGAHAADHTVLVNPNLTFSPAQLTIEVGDRVTWRNQGGFHNVRADDDSFRCANGCDGQGGNGDPSTDSWSVTLTFNDPGQINYYCEAHGAPGLVGMAGRLTVNAAGGDDDGDDDGDDPPPPPPPTDFNSNFEIADFADWDDRLCPSCNSVASTVAERRSVFPLAAPYRAAAGDRHRGLLAGPAEADLDLYLEWWNGAEWVPVASSNSPSADEEVAYAGQPGLYRWEVRSVSGGGDFELLFELPGAVAAAAGNELLRTGAAAKRGDFGVESTYMAGTRDRDYLIDVLPEEATRYTASFWINPRAGLAISGRKHEVMRLMRRGKPVVKVFLWAAEDEGGAPRLAVRAKSGRRFEPAVTLDLTAGRWRKITLVWTAAAAGETDGSLRIRRGSRLAGEFQELDNSGQRVDQIRFGQVTRGKRATEGVVFLDDFRSNWEN